MELTTLQFRADTSELLKAKTAIDDLSKSIGSLNVVVEKELKTQASVSKQKQDTVKANDNVTESVSKNTTALEKQQKILEYMTQGFSKGQASILATASAANAATGDLEKLGEVLQTQRKLMGASPFDKSMSGLVSLKNQYGEIREAIRQYNAETGLSRDQTRELARDKERIIEKMKLEGASLSQIKQAVREYNSSYTEAATKVNALTKAEKERERSTRDTTNAVRNLQSSEERLFATVAHLNDGISQNVNLNERAALALGSYERNLRLAGITGEQAAKKLQAFKAAQEQVSAAEAKNRANYVSRGVGVQLGDVGVSLASGMNPLLVMIQQGDQLRSIIQQSGLEAAQMGGIMQQAFSGIVTSFKDVGVAMGSFVLGGLKSMGDGVLSAIGKVTGLNYLIGSFRDNVLSAGPPTKAMALALSALDVAASIAGGAMAALLSMLALVGVAMYKSAKANDELLISLTTSGAALGMSSKELAAFANANNIAGTSANDLKIALGELAAAGFKQKDSLAVITEAAQKYSQATGKELNDVLKEYAKVAKEPVDSLIELGKATGLVSSATVLQVQAMIDAGDASGAAKLAMSAYADAQVKAANDIESSLSPLAQVFKELKNTASEAWDAVVEFANSNIVVDSIKNVHSALLLLVGITGHASIVVGAFFDVWKNPLGAKEKIEEAIVAMKNWDSVLEERNKRIQSPNLSSGISGVSDAEKQAEANRNAALESLRKNQQATLSETDKYVKKMQEYKSMLEKLSQTDPKDITIREQIIAQMVKESNTLQESQNKKNKTDSEGTKITNAYNSAMERFRDLTIEQSRAAKDGEKPVVMTTKAYAALQDIMDNKSWDSFSEQRKKDILTAYANAAAVEVHTMQLKLQAVAIENLKKASIDFEKADFDRLANITKVSKEIDFQYSLIGQSTEEARKMTREYELQAKQAEILTKYEKARLEQELIYNKEIKNITTPEARLAAEKEYLDKLGRLAIEQEDELVLARKKNNLDVLKDYEKQFLEMRDGLSEVMYQALTGKGKDAAQKLRDLIEAQLKKRFILPAIDVVINAVLNMVLGDLSGMAGGNTSNSTVGGLSQVANSYNSFGAPSGSLLSTGISAFGNLIGSSSVSAFGTGMTLTAAQAAEAAAAYSAAGMSSVGSALSAGSTLGSVMPYIGAATLAANVLGVFDSGGGPKTEGYAYGKIKDNKFTPGTTAAWMGLTGAQKGALEKSMGTYFANTLDFINKIGGSADGASLRLGFNADPAGTASDFIMSEVKNKAGKSIYGNTFDAGRGQASSQLPIEMQRMSLALIKASEGVPSIFKDIISGVNLASASSKVLADTFSKLQGIVTLRSIFESLGFSVDAVTKSLIDATGGVDALTKSLNSYYNNYYSDAEKQAKIVSDVSAVFKAANLEMPKSKEAFRKMVEQAISMGEAGNKAFATLMSVQDAFSGMIDNIKALQDEQLDQSYSALEASVEAEKKVLSEKYNAQVEAINASLEVDLAAYKIREDAAQESISNLKSIYSSLESALKKNVLVGYSQELARQTAARTLISNAAKSGNVYTVGLTDALDTLNSSDTKYYATFEEYARDQLKTSNDIKTLKDSAAAQIDVAEQTLFAIKTATEQARANTVALLSTLKVQYDSSIARLDLTLSTAREQLNALYGISNAVLSVKVALDNFNVSVSNAISAAKAPAPTIIVPDTSKLDAYSYYWSFDVGTNYVPYDMTANIHKGERIIPAADNAELLQAVKINKQSTDSSDMSEELRLLREEVSMLRYEARATATNTNKMVKQLDRTSDQQDSLKVTIVADQTIV